MPRRRNVAADNEYTVQSERIWRWLVENAGADEEHDRLTEAFRIYNEEAPGGLIQTKAGSAARAFVILHLVATERPLSAEYREFILRAGEDAAELDRIGKRLSERMKRFAESASRDREDNVRQHGDVYAQSGGSITHWPSDVAKKIGGDLSWGLEMVHLTADAITEVIREISGHLMDADLSDKRLTNIEDAARNLRTGGFTFPEIAELMGIAKKKGDPEEADRWRKIVERARKKLEPDKTAGTSASRDSGAAAPQHDPRAAADQTSGASSPPSRGARRNSRTANRRRPSGNR